MMLIRELSGLKIVYSKPVIFINFEKKLCYLMTPGEYHYKENCYINELLNTTADPDVSVARVRVLPGEITEWHILDGITERYLILEGSGFAEVGNNPPEEVSEGAIVHIPPGIRQRINNSGESDLIFLAVCTPRFDHEKYLALEI